MFLKNTAFNNVNLDIAINNANWLLENDTFISQIKAKTAFDMATCTPSEIANYMVAFNKKLRVNVKVYRPAWRWSKALGYYSPSAPLDINLNRYKLGRSVESFVATLIHEYIHIIDGMVQEHSFGHGNNSPVGKQNTAPYWIGNLAESFISGKPNFKDVSNGI